MSVFSYKQLSTNDGNYYASLYARQKLEAKAVMEERAAEIRSRVRPAKTVSLSSNRHVHDKDATEMLMKYRRHSGTLMPMVVVEDEHSISNSTSTSLNTNICGRTLTSKSQQNLRHSHMGFEISPLNETSNVFITHILSPVGIHLALTLHRTCGVRHISGTDPMLPNTPSHRLDMLRRLQLLRSEIPTLRVVKSSTGVARYNQQGYTLFKKRQDGDTPITHVVHLGGLESDLIYRRSNVVDISPYGNHPPLNLLRQGAISMEQLLISMLYRSTILAQQQKQGQDLSFPNFVTVSSLSLDLLMGKSEVESFEHTARIADDVLLSSFAKLYDMPSTHLILSNNTTKMMMYGPWIRSHSIIYELAREKLAQYGLLNPTNETAYEEADVNYSSSSTISLMYVDDVIDALLAAMQISHPRKSIVMDASSLSVNKSLSLLQLRNVLSRVLSNGSRNSTDIDSGNINMMIHHELPSHETKSDLSTIQVRYFGSHPMNNNQTSSFLQYTAMPTTTIHDGMSRLFEWMYNKIERPFSPNPLLFYNSSKKNDYEDKSTQEIRDRFVSCTSECTDSIKSSCVSEINHNADQRLLEVTQSVIKNYSLIMYTYDMNETLLELPLPMLIKNNPDEEYRDEQNRTAISVAFVHTKSPLVRKMLTYVANNDTSTLKRLAHGITGEEVFNQFSSRQNTNFCVDLPGYHTKNGSPVMLYECNGGKNQEWFYNSDSGHIRSGFDSNVCLSAISRKGSKLVVWKCKHNDIGEGTQRWEMLENGSVRSRSNKTLFITAQGCSTNKAALLELQYLWSDGVNNNRKDCERAQLWYLHNEEGKEGSTHGIISDTNDEESENMTIMNSSMLERYNGKLINRGWTLVWFTPPENEGDESYDPTWIKMTPGNLFKSPSVEYSLFIDSTVMNHMPILDDIYFLADESQRPFLPQRRQSYKYRDGKKKFFELHAEPGRIALMTVGKVNIHSVNPERSSSYRQDAIDKLLREHDIDDELMSRVRNQQEYYEESISFMNDLGSRSSNEPLYTFTLDHWIHTHWIMHDLRREEARALRCKWYREYIAWQPTKLYSLAFAFVMAKHEMHRKIDSGGAEDERLKHDSEPMEISELTDKREWIEIMDYERGWSNGIVEEDQSSERQNLYVRIVDKETLWYKRKAW